MAINKEMLFVIFIATFQYSILQILPVVVFFSSVVSILYYLGAMQVIIKCIAVILQVALSTTPIESFATAAHIFIGQVNRTLILNSSYYILPCFVQSFNIYLHFCNHATLW